MTGCECEGGFVPFSSTLDSRLRENDVLEHPPGPLTLCEGGRFLAALGMTWCECEGGFLCLSHPFWILACAGMTCVGASPSHNLCPRF